jgi:tRNA A-37 threonylcarbamoyl transferase component Bud32
VGSQRRAGAKICIVDRLSHGYTNFTRLINGHVEKVYDGPQRWAHATHELTCLVALRDLLPVAAVIDQDLSIPCLTLSLIPGRHGQDLIAEGHGVQVMRLVGEALAQLQAVAPETVRDLEGSGKVVVHGDFGPQNMLFDLDADRVTGVIDWESAHFGSRVEDLAWAEWIVRTHHPSEVGVLDHLFAAARQRPSWSERQAAMVRQIRDLLAYCDTAGLTASALDWRDRLRRTQAWTGE